jgi:hypothetical protein
MSRLVIIWSLAMAVLLSVACDDGMPTAPGTAGATVTLAIGQTIAVPDTSLSLKFAAVSSDSRCPVGVVCIQAGAAVVALDALAGAGTSRFELSTTGSAQVAQVSGYRIELASLLPERSASRPLDPADYRVTVHVDGR